MRKWLSRKRNKGATTYGLARYEDNSIRLVEFKTNKKAIQIKKNRLSFEERKIILTDLYVAVAQELDIGYSAEGITQIMKLRKDSGLQR